MSRIINWLFGLKDIEPIVHEKGESNAQPEEDSRPLDYRIYSGPDGTMAVIKHDYTEPRYIFDQNGGMHKMTKTGSAFNQTSLRGYIEILKRDGHDTSSYEKVLTTLEQETEKSGQTDAMNGLRLSGFLSGDLETGKVFKELSVPVGAPVRVQFFMPPEDDTPPPPTLG